MDVLDAILLLGYLFYGLGGFSCWIAKGCWTSLKDELSDNHKIRNIVVAACLFVVIAGIFIYLGLTKRI